MSSFGLHGEHLLRAKEVCALLKISLSTLWNKVARGALPAPIYLSPRLPRWRWCDIRPLIDGGRR
jgi:predicted DNA-binding transcriptional regulator AlpA